MSLPVADFPFSLFHDSKQDSSFSFPSPPASIISCTDSTLDFDIECFTNPSPGFDDPFSSSTPSSTALVSPKSSIADVAIGLNFQDEAATAESLSNHHLQRFLHYKALADQAEAQVRASAAQQANDFDSLFSSVYMPDDKVDPYNYGGLSNDAMLLYQTQPSYGAALPQWEPTLDYQPQVMNERGQHHMQAHQSALAHQRTIQMANYWLPQATAQTPYDLQNSLWNRQPGSTISGATPPFPSTPVYAPAQIVAPEVLPCLVPSNLPVQPMPVTPAAAEAPSPVEEGELELDEDLLSQYTRSLHEDEDIKPETSDSPILNQSGGGRGYVPGRTLDDPKKRHKCQTCGRGFARAFNLKVCFFCS